VAHLTIQERTTPLACVMGDMDLVRPVGMAGVSCAVVAPPGDPTRYSRFTRSIIEWADAWKEPEVLVERLLHFGRSQPQRPVLFYQQDRELLLVSRFRERLAEAFRFVVPDPDLVEDLVDKARFQALAERLELPVPVSRRVAPAEGSTPAGLGLSFPVIVKPITRRMEQWAPLADHGKALRVDTAVELRELWPRLAATGLELLVQECVPGPETRIESYHVYVDGHGRTAGEFTGRKVRTYPAEFGMSTAVEITNAPDVAALGRELTERLQLRGVAKLDFKRAPDGQLRLLEVNPRFSLWHLPGAVAGVNLPALVYADLTGLPRPAVAPVRAGVRWCYLWYDAAAARSWDLPLTRWLPWALSADSKSAMAWDDPMPFLRGVLWRRARRLVSATRTWFPRARGLFPVDGAAGEGPALKA
jgi:D-aspartate ligase